MQLSNDQRDLLKDFTAEVGSRLDHSNSFGNKNLGAVVAVLSSAVVAEDTSDYKESVRVATAGALPAFTRTGNYLNANADGALNDTGIDGKTDLAVGQRVLVQHGTSSSRGIYILSDLGSADSKWQMTRAADAAETGDLNSGSRVYVEEGTANAGKTFILSTAGSITINVTSQTWGEQSSSVTPAAVLAALVDSSVAKAMGGGKVTGIGDATVATDAMAYGQFTKLFRVVADNAALKALDVTTLADKAIIFKEDSEQLFHYDAQSSATETVGAPYAVVQPTAGAGRYLVIGQLEKRLRVCEDTAAVKALIVTSLADNAVVFVDTLQQFFIYDSGSAAAEALTPVSVIAPTAGAGRYLAMTNAPSAIPWFTAAQTSDPAAGDDLPASTNSTFALANRQHQRAPCKGIVQVWYIGEANPAGIDDANTAVFKIIKNDDTAFLTKTFNTATQPGAAFVPTSLGSFAVALGDVLAWECITGAAANLPKFGLQFDITPIA